MKGEQHYGWGASWLWSPIYKGIQFRLGHRAYFIGHVPREWKERGW